MTRDKLRPIGTEFYIVSYPFRQLSGDPATFAIYRYKVIHHTDLGESNWSEGIEAVDITKYRSPVWMQWCGQLLPTPHDELLPLLDDGWRILADAARRSFPDTERAVRIQ